MKMRTLSLIPVTFYHQVLSKVMDLTSGHHLSLLMMKGFNHSILKMTMILLLDLLELTIPTLSDVRNCLSQLKKRRVSVCGQ